jgi:hypothetical protein
MSKKGKIKNPSLRGHREKNTLRFRLKKTLVRIDAEGNELNTPPPVNTFATNWLSDHIAKGGGAEPPRDFVKNPLAEATSNVSSFAAAKAKRDVPPPVVSLEKAAYVKPPVSIEPVLKFDKPPSIVHNPLLTEPKPATLSRKARKKAKYEARKAAAVVQPVVAPPITDTLLDRKFWSDAKPEPRAPSGRLIREFLEGGKYAPQPPVVYTNPEVTKDWGKASNDKSWAASTQELAQWFINHVEVQNWPSHVTNFVHWKGDGPVVNTGAIEKAVADQATELKLSKALAAGLQAEWNMFDKALAYNEQEIAVLRQELTLTKQDLQGTRNEVRLLEYDLAHRTGDKESIAVMNKEMNVGYAEPPEDADALLVQFNQFNAFVRMDGLPAAFARYVYKDHHLGAVIQAQADWVCKDRQLDVNIRNLTRFLKDFGEYHRTVFDKSWVEFNKTKHDEYAGWWQAHYPTWRRAQFSNKRRTQQALVTNVPHARNKFKGMANTAMKSLITDSIYYSAVDRQRIINSTIAGIIVSKVQPSHARLNNPSLVEGDNRDGWHSKYAQAQRYVNWWTAWIDQCEMKYHESTTSGRILIGVVKGYNKLVDVMNTPVDNRTRNRIKKEEMRMSKDKHELDERREVRKEEKMQRKEARKLKDKIRALQRIAH